MEMDEIQRRAGELDWTRGQTLFLSDRIRNALAVLTSPLANEEQRNAAQQKLLATIEAIEDSGRQVIRISRDRSTTVVSSTQNAADSNEKR